MNKKVIYAALMFVLTMSSSNLQVLQEPFLLLYANSDK